MLHTPVGDARADDEAASQLHTCLQMVHAMPARAHARVKTPQFISTQPPAPPSEAEADDVGAAAAHPQPLSTAAFIALRQEEAAAAKARARERALYDIFQQAANRSMESERKEQTAATAASYMQADVAETLKRCLPGMSASEAQAVVANDPTLREQHERHKRLRYTEELVGRIAAVQAEWAMPECTALQSAEQMQHDLRSAIREHAHRRCPS